MENWKTNSRHRALKVTLFCRMSISNQGLWHACEMIDSGDAIGPRRMVRVGQTVDEEWLAQPFCYVTRACQAHQICGACSSPSVNASHPPSPHPMLTKFLSSSTSIFFEVTVEQ